MTRRAAGRLRDGVLASEHCESALRRAPGRQAAPAHILCQKLGRRRAELFEPVLGVVLAADFTSSY